MKTEIKLLEERMEERIEGRKKEEWIKGRTSGKERSGSEDEEKDDRLHLTLEVTVHRSRQLFHAKMNTIMNMVTREVRE